MGKASRRKKERKVLIIPAPIADDDSTEVKNAMALRARALTEGQCPACGAKPVFEKPPTPGEVTHATMEHESWCPVFVDDGSIGDGVMKAPAAALVMVSRGAADWLEMVNLATTRIQRGTGVRIPDNFHIMTDWPDYFEGGKERLVEYLTAYPEIRAVAISSAGGLKRRAQLQAEGYTQAELEELMERFNVRVTVS